MGYIICRDDNYDNTTAAVAALNKFTHNWCLNCEETDKQHKPIFRCSECPFCVPEEGSIYDEKLCLVKVFANDKSHLFPMDQFGAMV